MKRSPLSCPAEDDWDLAPSKRLRGGGGTGNEEQYYLDDQDLEDHMEPPEDIDSPPDTRPSVFPDIAEETRQRWLRPVNQITDNSADVNLQCLDMDLTVGKPLEKNPNESQSRVVGATNGQVPVIRAYGVSEAGNSVAVFIHG